MFIVQLSEMEEKYACLQRFHIQQGRKRPLNTPKIRERER